MTCLLIALISVWRACLNYNTDSLILLITQNILFIHTSPSDSFSHFLYEVHGSKSILQSSWFGCFTLISWYIHFSSLRKENWILIFCCWWITRGPLILFGDTCVHGNTKYHTDTQTQKWTFHRKNKQTYHNDQLVFPHSWRSLCISVYWKKSHNATRHENVVEIWENWNKWTRWIWNTIRNYVDAGGDRSCKKMLIELLHDWTFKLNKSHE